MSEIELANKLKKTFFINLAGYDEEETETLEDQLWQAIAAGLNAELHKRSIAVGHAVFIKMPHCDKRIIVLFVFENEAKDFFGLIEEIELKGYIEKKPSNEKFFDRVSGVIGLNYEKELFIRIDAPTQEKQFNRDRIVEEIKDYFEERKFLVYVSYD